MKPYLSIGNPNLLYLLSLSLHGPPPDMGKQVTLTTLHEDILNIIFSQVGLPP